MRMSLQLSNPFLFRRLWCSFKSLANELVDGLAIELGLSKNLVNVSIRNANANTYCHESCVFWKLKAVTAETLLCTLNV